MADPYAIIRTGGKQYRVKSGDVIDVELLGDAEDVTFNDVLLLSDGKEVKVGTPLVEGAIVQGKYKGEIKGPKVIAFKMKRRKNYRRKVGHRQRYAQVEITKVGA